ncbi:phosphatidylinositol 4-phosphate 3-kinase C2 domain-containing subunit beta isoform X1 [Bombus vosnesenskii]|uniref:Phosphatidylinositol 4-phosphate 3-kinase C2 domain-containing subunit beta isoform X1 n=2 Tax=Pyrobombus TaxID=144703 RepID=A0A6J3K9H2_9HYME|nr:phosphatidylinositol 4-phosphate 3-kinase C2 domain-containing subunit beta isoform X1 [Bombus impatiens]XP_012237473.1 phosphatidylinositol 4-phosphate 3-kinase C2 domain-containing subunit beta isoform X1 [Bombus impatiens]XP_024221374.1 phosphatidylinositol 4-phosphate 3-kinase C2 domain-containing subunit beta isoform X1 [Bombus impatiens]XP_033348698.1 phosphatidylinositol 4-phosphate 3-kinase C2 domain-containing subunit beta isoform X1 [Bombus vosnesenskii]XP_033348699.1 phosphatidyli
MSHYSRNTSTQRSAVIDYERQFQEDLELAQAMSLESLALEKFKLQKQRSDFNNIQQQCVPQSDGNSTVHSSSSERDNTQQTEKFQCRSRPRPGSCNTNQSRNAVILAPPPVPSRRNSTTATTSQEHTVDLITFTSPVKQDNLNDYCSPPPPPSRKATVEPRWETHPSLLKKQGRVSRSTSSAGYHSRDYRYQSLSPGPRSSTAPCTPGTPKISPVMSRSSSINSNVPDITPQPAWNLNDLKNFFLTHSQIPPLPMNYRPSITPSICGVQKPTFCMDDEQLNVLKVIEKKPNNNLIDLSSFDQVDDKTNVRVSVLEAFDPLLVKIEDQNDSTQGHKDEIQSQVSGSVYDPFDPFDYMYSTNESVNSDPVYVAVEKSAKSPAVSPAAPPPLPPRNSSAWNTIERRRTSLDRRKRQTRLYENVTVRKTRPSLHDCDLRAFYDMIKSVRSEFPFNDPSTNIGHVISPMMESLYPEGTSIKLVVHPQLMDSDENTPSISFTCDVNCSVEHVILNVACSLEDEDIVNIEKYCLRVWGLAEYFASNTTLAQYEYIHQCIKLEKDIELAILTKAQIKRSITRTLQDDNRDQCLKLEDILPNEPVQPISYDTLLILLETVEKEMERVETAAIHLATTNHGSSLLPQLQPRSVVQAVKAVCALMGNIETFEITEAVDNFVNACCQFLPQVHTTNIECKKPEILHEDGDYSVVTLRTKFPDVIASHCRKIRDAIQDLVETYCHAFRVDFELNSRGEIPTNTLISSEVLDTILVRVGALHRLPGSWKHDDYIIAAQIFHGTRPVGNPVLSEPMAVSSNFHPRILFNSWLEFRGISVCQVPREARLVLVLYGRTLQPTDHESNSSAENTMQKEELGWGAIQFFDYEGVMSQGSFFLSLWPAIADKRLGPAPAAGIHPHGDTHAIIGVELPDYGGRVLFPTELRDYDVESLDFNSLDQNTQELLIDITQQTTFSRPLVEEREILWEKRHYLHNRPEALPKVLLAAHSWDWACLPDLHASLRIWSPLPPVQALQLLLPCFPDMKVREMAVGWIRELSNDELVDYLPQLLQALKHETYETSPLTKFLLERALLSPRVAHHIYWLLTQALPGQSPQNSAETTPEDDKNISSARYHRRLQLMLRALLAVIGDALRNSFLTQQLLVKNLYEVAENIKQTKESLRLDALKIGLQNIHCQLMEDDGTCLPLSPSKQVFGINVQSCSYFPSFTLPLKINFISCDDVICPAIFKVGDDLQQDMLTLQMMRIMDKLWLKEGLDLKMVTFACVPTGYKRGMIEMVTNAETLRKIQVEFGLTGSFKDRPIAEWLAKHNPSELEYERAVENFTASCAGYSVATYILGICDRHNDNIMLKTSGHLFHIDFGKFLGDAQMFGNFKRDRTPFVLTSDMAYVINGGDKPSAKFHHFVDLCCQAFNVVRKHGNLILHLFGLMTSSGIPGVTVDAVSYVQKALLPEQTNPEAAATFARMIESSLKSWFTQFNFFLHNLAQLRFSGDHNDGALLSFIPRTYTMQQEGQLTSVQVHGYQKRYDPEKYYMYILRIQRKGHADPTYLFRSYKEFCEFYQKLCIHFPLAKLASLPSGISVGRSNIKQVADKRRADIEKFLVSLFKMAPEISQSDLVYTFFHPLLRDQQNADIHLRKVKVGNWWAEKRVRDNVQNGQIKMSLHYTRGAFYVMVYHARGLPKVANCQEPNTYVKVYLKPDPTKKTKRKTKVVKKNCHPSFMEMLEYRMALDVIKERTLEATIWNHDTLQENEFLGGIRLPLGRIDLTTETIEWFSLGSIR